MDHINIHFTITDEEYLHWHRLAFEQKQLEPAQIAQRAYFKWLYRKAVKMGWINGHERQN